MNDYTAHEIHRLDQAYPDAVNTIDDLTGDPARKTRLAEVGPEVFAAELTRDLANSAATSTSLAAWAAVATVQLMVAGKAWEDDTDLLHAKVGELTAERDNLVAYNRAVKGANDDLREQLTAANRRADGLRADERSRGRAALIEYRDANHRHHHRVPGYCICGDDWDDEGCTEYVGLTEAAQLYTGERAEATR